jgi:uncharacterized protein
MSVSPLPSDDRLAELVLAAVARHSGDEVAAAIQSVPLFGSAAVGRMRPDSDIDLAILRPGGTAPIEPVALFDAAQTVAIELGRDVDLVDLRSVSTVFATQILAHGRRIRTQDEYESDLFTCHTLSEHARLNERRREIVERFEAERRGSRLA